MAQSTKSTSTKSTDNTSSTSISTKSKSENLRAAKAAKNDEFYTQFNDIQNELQHYERHFKNKIVYCNCDDPMQSHFFGYFLIFFERLGLKGLITTCYKSANFDKISDHKSPKQSVMIEVRKENFKDFARYSELLSLSLSGRLDGKKQIEFDKQKAKIQKYIKPLYPSLYSKENPKESVEYPAGDFRSNDCIKLLKKADIVVTNPPFSLFREYVAQLIEYKKKFLIIGPLNAISYKDIFKLIKENQLWQGYGSVKQFIDANPNSSEKFKIFGNVGWYSNLDIKKRHEILETIYSYKKTPDKYPKYDNYDAINVDKVNEIPLDYDGVMGVPITFLGKHNPEQFEIEALGIVGSIEFSCAKKMEILDKNGKSTGKFTINAKGTLYKKYDPKIDKKPPAFKDCKTGELYSSIYARVIIRKIQAKDKKGGK